MSSEADHTSHLNIRLVQTWTVSITKFNSRGHDMHPMAPICRVPHDKSKFISTRRSCYLYTYQRLHTDILYLIQHQNAIIFVSRNYHIHMCDWHTCILYKCGLIGYFIWRLCVLLTTNTYRYMQNTVYGIQLWDALLHFIIYLDISFYTAIGEW